MRSFTDLYLFPRLTRPEYFKRYGVQAPPWDKSRRIQRWFDPEADGGATTLQYSTFNTTTGKWEDLFVSAREAASPNLPGKYEYPKHQIAPTRAVLRSIFDGSEHPLNPAYLCEESEALALASELGLSASAIRQTQFGGPWQFVWNGESRRLWVLDYEGEIYQAAGLIAAKHREGVGSPGKWNIQGKEITWIPVILQDTGEMDPRPEVPMPMSGLNWDERLKQGLGGIWVIVKIDNMTDRELLEAIYAAVRK